MLQNKRPLIIVLFLIAAAGCILFFAKELGQEGDRKPSKPQDSTIPANPGDTATQQEKTKDAVPSKTTGQPDAAASTWKSYRPPGEKRPGMPAIIKPSIKWLSSSEVAGIDFDKLFDRSTDYRDSSWEGGPGRPVSSRDEALYYVYISFSSVHVPQVAYEKDGIYYFSGFPAGLIVKNDFSNGTALQGATGKLRRW